MQYTYFILGVILCVTTIVEAETLRELANISASVDKSKISVSGLSSGAFFAVQYHVAWSSEIMGAAIFAGGPYYCAEDSAELALNVCMPGKDIDVNFLDDQTTYFETMGWIDSTSNLQKSYVYLFSGTEDTVVSPTTMKLLNQYYQNYVPTDQIATEFSKPSEHAFPTTNYGNPCNYLGSPYINNCGFDGAGAALQQIYRNLIPAIPANGTIVSFNQSNFLPDLTTLDEISLETHGFIYVPTGCQDPSNTCFLHVVFHGCLQNLDDIQDLFYTKTGYNEWAEANNIIVVYPQAKKSSVIPYNPDGCWDWWGYAGVNYPIQEGLQIQTVHNIIHSFLK